MKILLMLNLAGSQSYILILMMMQLNLLKEPIVSRNIQLILSLLQGYEVQEKQFL